MGIFKDFSYQRIRGSLKSSDQWVHYPKASDRKAWDEILKDDLQKKRHLELMFLIQGLPENPYPILTAKLFMEFKRNGNRDNYEQVYFKRRQNFALFVLAECFEGKGEFIDQVIEGFWQILCEPTWVIPAHARVGRSSAAALDHSDDPLPNDTMETVDLFSAETAMVLAQALYLLEDQLIAVSPNLVIRVRNEIERKVLKEVEKCQDGFGWWNGHNNWAIWCSFNILGAAFYVIKDLDRLARLTKDLMGVADRFFDTYSDDGACDEGPMYWGVSAGMLFLFLDLLEGRIDGIKELYKNEKLINMTKYICDVQLHRDYFANFSDSNAKMGCTTSTLFLASYQVDSPALRHLAWNLKFEFCDKNKFSSFTRRINGGDLTHMIRDIMHVKKPTGDASLKHVKSIWYPKLEIAVLRESVDSSQGLIFYFKGGSNGENHNHNDLGQFCLLKNGEQVFIDIGREVYCKDTFNENRYQNWHIRGSGHNIPILNGCEQVFGKERKTQEVSFESNTIESVVKMDISLAYNKESKVKNYCRTMRFLHEGASSLEITDVFNFDSNANVIEHPIYCAQKVVASEPGKLVIGEGDSQVVFRFNPLQFSVELSEIPILDSILKNSWGEKIYKIFLKGSFEGKGQFVFKVS